MYNRVVIRDTRVKEKGEEQVTKEVQVYLSMTQAVSVKDPQVKVKDVVTIYCEDALILGKIKNLTLLHLKGEKNEKQSVTILYVTKTILQGLKEVSLNITALGETDCVVCYMPDIPEKKWVVALKESLVGLTVFFGAAFAIMTYNQDVDVPGVFGKLHYIFTGTLSAAPGVLEIAYAIGLAVGVTVFFNHFGGRKWTSDPTPMEVAMTKYEKDMMTTLIKEEAREEKAIDIS